MAPKVQARTVYRQRAMRERIHEGFRRLALVAGGIALSFVLLLAIGELIGGSASLLETVRNAGIALVFGVVAWAAVRLVGWVVAGFFSDRNRHERSAKGIADEAVGAYKNGQDVAHRMLAAADAVMDRSLEAVSDRYMEVFAARLYEENLAHAGFSEAQVAQVEAGVFVNEVGELAAKVREKAREDLASWYSVAQSLEFEATYQAYIDKKVDDAMQLLEARAAALLEQRFGQEIFKGPAGF